MPYDLTDNDVEILRAMRDAMKDQIGGMNRGLGSSTPDGEFPPPPLRLIQSHLVYIKNNSGAVVPAGGVLGLDGAVLTNPSVNTSAFLSNFLFKGTTPTIADYFRSFAIALRPIAVGNFGPACINGPCPAKVQIVNANHKYANIVEGSTGNLKSAGSGMVRIRAVPEPGTGVKWAYVEIDAAKDRIPVALTQTGGSAGTRTVECTFTYTAKTLDGGDTIATGVSLLGHRVVNAAMTAATYGEIGADHTNTWKIFWCDERITQTNCT